MKCTLFLSLYGRLLLSWTSLLLPLLLFLICLCRSGNIINQYINKQLVRLISEMHTQTHTRAQTYPLWMLHLHRSGTSSRSDPELWDLWDARPTRQWRSERGDTTLASPPLFYWRKKKNIMGRVNIHTHLREHTSGHSGAQTQTVPCVNTLYAPAWITARAWACDGRPTITHTQATRDTQTHFL